MARFVRSPTHVAYVTTYRNKDCAVVEVYKKVWPKGEPHKDTNYSFGPKVSEYETAIKGATTSATRELNRLSENK